MEFRSLSALFNFLDQQLQTAMESVAEEVKQLMHDYIQTNLYDAYQPTEYIRTYDYLNSLSVKPVRKENGWNVVEIYFDPSTIKQDIQPFWNAHMSVYGNKEWKGTPINELIPLWLNEGVESPLYSHKGIHVVDNTIEELKSTKMHLEKIKDLLQTKGIRVELK
jgi:hypothetical protein